MLYICEMFLQHSFKMKQIVYSFNVSPPPLTPQCKTLVSRPEQRQLKAGAPESRDSIPDMGIYLSSLYSIRTSCGSQPAYSPSTEGTFPEDKWP
jgi:hypothetical protein